MNPRQKLFHIKGLGDIVISTEIKTVDLVSGLPFCRKHNDRYGRLLAEIPADLPAVFSRKHNIQQNHIR